MSDPGLYDVPVSQLRSAVFSFAHARICLTQLISEHIHGERQLSRRHVKTVRVVRFNFQALPSCWFYLAERVR
jgi:hypothetical protein